jgi:hypothetical protein
MKSSGHFEGSVVFVGDGFHRLYDYRPPNATNSDIAPSPHTSPRPQPPRYSHPTLTVNPNSLHPTAEKSSHLYKNSHTLWGDWRPHSGASQLPLWDFFECNPLLLIISATITMTISQFPLWDFFECNTHSAAHMKQPWRAASQFPLWDFFECNKRLLLPTALTISLSLNSLFGISLNAT